MINKETKAVIDLLTLLNIDIPTNIRADQMLNASLLASVKTMVTATLAKVATGDAVVADVAEGKIFSTATAVGLVGTYVAPTVAELTADADALAADIRADKTAYVNGIKLVGTAVIS